MPGRLHFTNCIAPSRPAPAPLASSAARVATYPPRGYSVDPPWPAPCGDSRPAAVQSQCKPSKGEKHAVVEPYCLRPIPSPKEVSYAPRLRSEPGGCRERSTLRAPAYTFPLGRYRRRASGAALGLHHQHPSRGDVGADARSAHVATPSAGDRSEPHRRPGPAHLDPPAPSQSPVGSPTRASGISLGRGGTLISHRSHFNIVAILTRSLPKKHAPGTHRGRRRDGAIQRRCRCQG